MSRVSRAFRLTGKLIRFIIGLIIFAVIAMLLWRVFSSSNPKELELLTPNEKLAAAYEEYGESLRLFKQDQRSITSGESNYGYFSVTQNIFIPEANQVQLLFRYNNSTIKALESDYALESTPARSDELFEVSLVFYVDKTPDDTEDNLRDLKEMVRQGKVDAYRVYPSYCEVSEKNIYNFRKMIFDLDSAGFDLQSSLEDNTLLAVLADVYYVEDVNYDENAYGTLCLYDYLTENIEIKPSKVGLEALETYTP